MKNNLAPPPPHHHSPSSYLKDKERWREISPLLVRSPNAHISQRWAGQRESTSQELHQEFPSGWQKTKYPSHHLTEGRAARRWTRSHSVGHQPALRKGDAGFPNGGLRAVSKAILQFCLSPGILPGIDTKKCPNAEGGDNSCSTPRVEINCSVAQTTTIKPESRLFKATNKH